MQAGKQKLFVTQIYKRFGRIAAGLMKRSSGLPGKAVLKNAAMAIALAVTLGVWNGTTSAQAAKFVSTRAAFEQGIEAYRAEYYEIAIPALKYAAAKGSFVAKYYLARIYSDPRQAYTNHGQAYRLYYQIARDNLDIDPVADRRAIIVAKSLTAMAVYIRRGLPSIGLRASARKAAEFLRQSAFQFGDVDAQFELAKLYLSGDGVRKDAQLARHFLSVLTRKGHAGAQAFLADLLWRGKYVKQDRAKALALITMAMAHAPERERLWIEDIHQNIYCGTTKGTRKQATGFVAVWKKQYGRISPDKRKQKTASLDTPVAERLCADGELVTPVLRKKPRKVKPPAYSIMSGSTGGEELNPPKMAKDEPTPLPRIMQGGATGFGLRDVGSKPAN